jgi:hypothetical protein
MTIPLTSSTLSITSCVHAKLFLCVLARCVERNSSHVAESRNVLQRVAKTRWSGLRLAENNQVLIMLFFACTTATHLLMLLTQLGFKD